MVTEFQITGEEKFEESLFSRKYKQSRSLRLALAVEVDERNNVLEQDPETPSHFCVFPLIGCESHLMSVILNSPDFEPDFERESLFLHGKEIDDVKHIITDCGINHMILQERIALFDLIVMFLSKNHQNLYYLAKCLQTVPDVPKFFNQQ